MTNPTGIIEPQEVERLDSLVSAMMGDLMLFNMNGGSENQESKEELKRKVNANYFKTQTLYELVGPVLQPNGRSVDHNLLKALVFMYADAKPTDDEKYQRMLRLRKFLPKFGIDFDDPRVLELLVDRIEKITMAYAAHQRHYPNGNNGSVPTSSG